MRKRNGAGAGFPLSSQVLQKDFLQKKTPHKSGFDSSTSSNDSKEPSYKIPRISVAVYKRKFDFDCNMQKSLELCMRWMGYAEILARARARKGEAQGVLTYQKVTGIFDNPHI